MLRQWRRSERRGLGVGERGAQEANAGNHARPHSAVGGAWFAFKEEWFGYGLTMGIIYYIVFELLEE